MVLLKLTRNARGESVSGALETTEELEDCRRVVRDNGFEVMPEGRMGPKFFVPVAAGSFKAVLLREGIDKVATLSYVSLK